MLNWWGLGSAYRENPAIGWMLVTFFIFLALIRHFVKKPLGDFLQTRSENIKNAIEEGKRTRAEAEAKLNLYNQRLLELDAEITKMRADFMHQGDLERARLEQEAKQIAEQILKESEQTLKADVSRALQALKQEIALKILNTAQKTLPLGADLDQKLCANFVRNP